MIETLAEGIKRRREETRVTLLAFMYDSKNSPFTIPGMHAHLKTALGHAPSEPQLYSFIRDFSEMSLSPLRQEGVYYHLRTAEEQTQRRREIFS